MPRAAPSASAARAPCARHHSPPGALAGRGQIRVHQEGPGASSSSWSTWRVFRAYLPPHSPSLLPTNASTRCRLNISELVRFCAPSQTQLSSPAPAKAHPAPPRTAAGGSCSRPTGQEGHIQPAPRTDSLEPRNLAPDLTELKCGPCGSGGCHPAAPPTPPHLPPPRPDPGFCRLPGPCRPPPWC